VQIFIQECPLRINDTTDLMIIKFPNTISSGKILYRDLFSYESIKRGLKRRLIYEYRRDERLETKNKESTRLSDTGLVVELEHLKTKTRLKDEMFVSVKGECET
jgi:hypothetical protein